MAKVIVGSGICGLWLARYLVESGERELVIVDKARGVGGRIATRRTETAKFDHGAQFYTLRNSLLPLHERWLAADLVQMWFADDLGRERIASPSGLTALAKNLAQGLDVRLEQKVVQLERQDHGWQLQIEDGSRIEASSVVLTCPLPQSLELLKKSGIEFDPVLSSVRYAKALVGLFENVTSPARLTSETGFLVPLKGGIFSISNQASKGLCPTPGWTVTMAPDFSDRYFGMDDSRLLPLIAEQIRLLDGGFAFESAQIKSWRYSHPLNPLHNDKGFFEVAAGLYLAGDAFGGASIGGAVASASALADSLTFGKT